MTIRTKQHDSRWNDLPGLEALKRIPTKRSVKTISPVVAMTRAYLKCLHAAEMTTWEITGGDYMLSRFATNSLRNDTDASAISA